MSLSGDTPVFRREDVLAGSSARRATTLLFAIEGRAAQLADRTRTAMAGYLTERAQRDHERAFLDALASGRHQRTLSITELERYAPDWASLVPPDAQTRASLAGLIAGKYRFRERDVPGIRRALQLAEPAVVQAFQQAHGRPLQTIYADSLPWAERLRWRRMQVAARLEELPPTWMAFALTLTETVGAGVLALPIAFAAVGPRAAALLLAVFGLVNILTLAALVEAITRDGTMRYGSAYFGTFVGQYLGPPGRWVVSAAILLLNAIGLVALMIGFGSALEGVSGVPSGAWAAVLAVLIMLILRRETLDATVASALVIGAVNILLLVGIGVVALLHLDVELLSSTGTGGASVTGLIFGTALMAYFGHTSAGNAAKVVLRRDPGGRALMRGNVWALVVAMVLYGLTVVAILGAVPAVELNGYDGTALTPLVAVTGPVVAVFGAVFVVLAMGLSSLHIALGLYNQVGEWLPDEGAGSDADRGGRMRAAVTSKRGRALAKALPVVALLIVLELLLLSGAASFTGSLSFLGTVTVPLLGGLFPMLLIAATRRRGEYVPMRVRSAIGHPVVVGCISAVFFAGLLAHALVIWQGPWERSAAVVSSLAFLVVLGWSLRNKAFAQHTVVELRFDPGPPDRLSVGVVAAGAALHAPVMCTMADGTQRAIDGQPIGDARLVRSATVDLPPDAPPRLQLWSHQIDATGTSTSWPNRIRVEHNGGDEPVTLDSDGRATIMASGGARLVIERMS